MSGRGTLVLLFSAACGGSDPEGVPDAAPPPLPPDAGEPRDERACHAIHDEAALVTLEVEISDDAWNALLEDHRLHDEREAAGQDPHPYHPLIAFRWGERASSSAMIRLKGHSTWHQPKLQFVISFNEADPDGRFLGLRKLSLDAAPEDRTLLRERLALSWFRGLGIAAPCANSARLVVNGAYFGLYTNVERVDREFLERNFVDPDGNLYKYGRNLMTNEDAPDTSRLDLLDDAMDLAALAALVDLDAALAEWAGEAALPQPDGYFAGRGNFYLYDEPGRGFVWIPWDLDLAFDWAPFDTDPILYEASGRDKQRHFAIVISDAVGRARYVDALAAAIDAFDAKAFAARLDVWHAQIAAAVAADPSKPFTTEQHLRAVDELRAFVVERAAFLTDWIACERDPEGARDADGDGTPWCADCDEVSCER